MDTSAFRQRRPRRTCLRFFAAVDAIAKDLRDNPITEDELTRAKTPTIESTRRNMNANYWWAGQLADVGIKPDSVTETLNTISDLQDVTPDVIQDVARRYLRPDTSWRGTVVSRNQAPTL